MVEELNHYIDEDDYKLYNNDLVIPEKEIPLTTKEIMDFFKSINYFTLLNNGIKNITDLDKLKITGYNIELINKINKELRNIFEIYGDKININSFMYCVRDFYNSLSWFIITPYLVQELYKIIGDSSVLEICAGKGVLSSILIELGCNIKITTLLERPYLHIKRY